MWNSPEPARPSRRQSTVPRVSATSGDAADYAAQLVEAAWRIADRALDLSGGFGMFKKSELERLFRDARAGRFHPANAMLTHELVGSSRLAWA
jgi:alkylation response protein AidB-like acyl-CoA dehydrogenase